MSFDRFASLVRYSSIPMALLTFATSSGSTVASGLDLKAIQSIEAKIKLPKGSNKLEEYARCYQVSKENNEHITGVYVLGDKPAGISIDDCSQEVLFLDGGCSAVYVLIDIPTEKVLSMVCNDDP